MEAPASFHGLRVWGIDGSMLTAPDSSANLATFGRLKASRGQSAFCHLGLVCLVDVARHLVRDAVPRQWDGSEVAGAHRLIRHLGEGDLRPGRTKEVTMRVRVIDYRLPRHGRVRLVTSLLDREAFPIEELAILYHRRWEAELAFDELKVHQNSTACGQLHTTFRRQTPRGVFQEAYALLAAYNLTRFAMAEAAAPADLDPRTLSLMVPQMQAAETRRLPALRQRLLDALPTRAWTASDEGASTPESSG